jgi:hypothetical protein
MSLHSTRGHCQQNKLFTSHLKQTAQITGACDRMAVGFITTYAIGAYHH